MFATLRLFVPILIPSWRFFRAVEPSPRIEWTLVYEPDDVPQHWMEFCPRPQKVSFGSMLHRLFWNPGWNEYLFVISCAERLIKSPTRHSQSAIAKRVRRTLPDQARGWFLYRIILIDRVEDGFAQTECFRSQSIFIDNP